MFDRTKADGCHSESKEAQNDSPANRHGKTPVVRQLDLVGFMTSSQSTLQNHRDRGLAVHL